MNIHFSKIITNCNIILVIQILTTLQTFFTNLPGRYSPPGTTFFLFKILAQCVICILLINNQKKNPTLKGSLRILLVSLFTGHFSLYWIGFDIYTSYLGWALIIAVIFLIVNQRKYDRMA